MALKMREIGVTFGKLPITGRRPVVAAVLAAGLIFGSAASSRADFVTTDPTTTMDPSSTTGTSTDPAATDIAPPMDPTYDGTTVDSGIDDPLHIYFPGFHDNGQNTPFSTTVSQPTNFGFTISPGPNTGYFYVVILTPNNKFAVPSVGITGTLTDDLGHQYSTTTTATRATPTVSAKTVDWTSGDLAAYLLLPNATPSNPIGAFDCQPAGKCANAYDPGLTGFHVYIANLSPTAATDPTDPTGKTKLLSPSAYPDGTTNLNVMPELSLTQALPVGSYVVAFMNIGTKANPTWIATAPSGAGLITSRAPEPASLALLGTALAGMYLGGVVRSRGRRRRERTAGLQ